MAHTQTYSAEASFATGTILYNITFGTYTPTTSYVKSSYSFGLPSTEERGFITYYTASMPTTPIITQATLYLNCSSLVQSYAGTVINQLYIGADALGYSLGSEDWNEPSTLVQEFEVTTGTITFDLLALGVSGKLSNSGYTNFAIRGFAPPPFQSWSATWDMSRTSMVVAWRNLPPVFTFGG